jgi:hypothetical protein
MVNSVRPKTHPVIAGKKLMSEEHAEETRFDRPAVLVFASVAIFFGLAVILIAVLEQTWLITLVALIVLAVFVLAYLYTRRKNVAWRVFQKNFGEKFTDMQYKKDPATGPGKLGEFTYMGVSSYGSPTGLEVRGLLCPSISIPWGAISKIDAVPNVLSGRKGFESDMEARVTLRDHPERGFQFPWLKEFHAMLPRTVKYREYEVQNS